MAISAVIPVVISIVGAVYGYGKFKEKVDNTTKDFSDYKNKVDENVKSIEHLKGSFDTLMKTSIVQKGSPLRLTDTGKKLLEESGGKKLIEKVFDKLLPHFDKIDNAYDIQEKAKDVVKKIEVKDGIVAVKNYLFATGNSFDDLATAMSIELRDKVLKQKGITVEQIDMDEKHSSEK